MPIIVSDPASNKRATASEDEQQSEDYKGRAAVGGNHNIRVG
jgi:hypothetical protein